MSFNLVSSLAKVYDPKASISKGNPGHMAGDGEDQHAHRFNIIQVKIESLSEKMDRLIHLQGKVINRLDGMSQEIGGLEQEVETLMDTEDTHVLPEPTRPPEPAGTNQVKEMCREMSTIMSAVNQRSEQQEKKLEGMEKLVLGIQEMVSFIGETVKGSQLMELLLKRGSASPSEKAASPPPKEKAKDKGKQTIKKQESTDKTEPVLSKKLDKLKDQKGREGKEKPCLGLKSQKLQSKPSDTSDTSSLQKQPVLQKEVQKLNQQNAERSSCKQTTESQDLETVGGVEVAPEGQGGLDCLNVILDIPQAPAAQHTEEQGEVSSKDESKTIPTKKDECKSVPTRKDESKSIPTKKDESKSVPTRKDESKTLPTKKDESKSAPTKKDESKSVPTKKDESKSVPTKKDETKSVPTKKDESKSAPTKKDESKSAPTKKDESKSVPTKKDESKSVPTKKDETKSVPTKKDDSKTVPTRKHESKSVPTRKDDDKSQPTKKDESKSVPTRKDESTSVPSTSVEAEHDKSSDVASGSKSQVTKGVPKPEDHKESRKLEEVKTEEGSDEGKEAEGETEGNEPQEEEAEGGESEGMQADLEEFRRLWLQKKQELEGVQCHEEEQNKEFIIDVTHPPVAPFSHRIVTPKTNQINSFYTINKEEILGGGRFGQVHKCVENSSGLTLAAKIIKARSVKEKDVVKNEIQVMNQLDHATLIQLYAAYESRMDVILVLEYVDGGELFDRIIDENYKLTELDSVHFIRQICEGVQHMHKMSIVHLDLKPENIMCVSRVTNKIKIIDFGLARMYKPRERLKVSFGTPEFLAPEVVNYEFVSFRTDMWSLGVITYMLLSSLSPFLGDDDNETLNNILACQWTFEEDEFTDISEEARDFISKLLVLNKSWRMNSSEALEHAWLSDPGLHYRLHKKKNKCRSRRSSCIPLAD